MQNQGKYCLFILLVVGLFTGGRPAMGAQDLCAVCDQPIRGAVYITTDKVTNEKKLLCVDCLHRPACTICSLPVREDALRLPDGRYLCARDARTAVVKAADAERVCVRVKDDLDRLFSRFTTFPDTVDVTVIDRIDVDAMFSPDGNEFESPNLMGCVRTETVNGEIRYKMRLMSGLPLVEMKSTCAHEYAHTWVHENVSRERKAGLARDAEEGFCELIAYLLMDSQREEGQKKFILQNRYTRGQIDVFIEAEKRYGFDQVMDWMKYGEAAQLEAGRVDKLRDVKIPAAKSAAGAPIIYGRTNPPARASAPAVLKLDGVMWSSRPTAIINGRSFLANDMNQVKIGGTNVMIRCLDVRQTSARIQYVKSGQELELQLSTRPQPRAK